MPKAGSKRGASGLLTLSEVAKRTGISMPTLQRYKKLYQDRIPSEGEGRKQRYPKKSLKVFEALKKENIAKRGRPRKGGAAAADRPMMRRSRGRKPAKAAGRSRARSLRTARRAPAASTGGLLTLTQISETTGISYPTLIRYVKLHSDQIPHEGEGRKRRFHSAAIAVFEKLRGETRRGRRAGTGTATARKPRRAAGSGRRAGRPARTGTSSGTGTGSGDGSVEKRLRAVENKLDSLIKRLDRVFR